MTALTPVQLSADSPLIPKVLDLIQRAFAPMDQRIDPPSSMHRLTPEAISDQCRTGEIWVIGTEPKACMFLSKKDDFLYLSKLAVDPKTRRQGFGARLVRLAEDRAAALKMRGIELETRIELTENHATFQRLGFVKTGEGAHQGFTRPTFIIMRKMFDPHSMTGAA